MKPYIELFPEQIEAKKMFEKYQELKKLLDMVRQPTLESILKNTNINVLRSPLKHQRYTKRSSRI